MNVLGISRKWRIFKDLGDGWIVRPPNDHARQYRCLTWVDAYYVAASLYESGLCRRCGNSINFEAGDWYHDITPEGTMDARFCHGDDTRDDQIADPIPTPMEVEG